VWLREQRFSRANKAFVARKIDFESANESTDNKNSKATLNLRAEGGKENLESAANGDQQEGYRTHHL
jgi:hypothetical protein